MYTDAYVENLLSCLHVYYLVGHLVNCIASIVCRSWKDPQLALANYVRLRPSDSKVKLATRFLETGIRRHYCVLLVTLSTFDTTQIWVTP